MVYKTSGECLRVFGYRDSSGNARVLSSLGLEFWGGLKLWNGELLSTGRRLSPVSWPGKRTVDAGV